jgi:two-component system phosphate regulon sensor histidine kinase PhoR
MALAFRTKLLATHVAVAAVVIAVTILALNRTLGQELVQRADARLAAQARGAGQWILTGRHSGMGGGGGGDKDPGRYGRIAERLAATVDARVTIYDAAGRVLGDSGMPADEIEADMRYVREPIGDGLVVRLGAPMREVRATLDSMRRRILWAAAIGLAMAIALALAAARAAVRPLRAMTESAARIAEGDYHPPLPPPTRDEFGVLAEALRSLARQLEARIGELVAMERSRRDFMANASHELRTPVTAIRGYAETLLAQGGDDKMRREFVEVIHRHADRIGTLVEDMLALAALEARRPGEGVREPVALAGVARQVAKTLRVRAEARGVGLVVEVPDDVRVVGDAEELERVLQNLVDNAIKYGKDGGRVTVRARAGGAGAGRVLVEVEDDGPGIPAEHLPRLFERFYRVDPGRSREQGGTGLGLAIVKQLVDGMGGGVRVESTVGRGTRVLMELPPVPPAPSR